MIGRPLSTYSLRPQLSPAAASFLQLLAASARIPAAALEPPARTWLEAYRVRRCACGSAVAAGGGCRACGGTGI